MFRTVCLGNALLLAILGLVVMESPAWGREPHDQIPSIESAAAIENIQEDVHSNRPVSLFPMQDDHTRPDHELLQQPWEGEPLELEIIEPEEDAEILYAPEPTRIGSSGLTLPPPKQNRADDPMKTSPRQMLATVGSSLSIVLGIFLLLVWISRRSGSRNPTRALPHEVVEVLGCVSLGGRQALQLVRLGSKLVLINASASEIQAVSEVTEPQEVDRLVRLCRGEGFDVDTAVATVRRAQAAARATAPQDWSQRPDAPGRRARAT